MATTRSVTVEEFETMPLDGLWELVDGELVELSPAGGRSGWIGGRLFARLAEHVEQRSLGWAFPADTGFILFGDRHTVRSPDAAVVRRERLAELTNTFVPLAPDLAAEVLSPSDRMTEALSKITMYLEAGVHVVWLVDPETRTVTVFRPDVAPRTFTDADMLDGGEVLPGFSVPVSDIFP